MIRLFVEDRLGPGAEVALNEARAHYLIDVMRQGAGADLLAFNGRDGEWRARLAVSGKRAWKLEAVSRTRSQTLPPDLDLIAAIVKRPRLETIIEKAAELGARRVVLVASERTVTAWANLPRLRAIATEAAEQTGRMDVPEILEPRALGAAIDARTDGRRLLFCDEAGDAPGALDALRGGGAGPWAILIGPEGGFSPRERAMIRAATGVHPVSLGPRILRADTAAIAAMTLWQASLGDWVGT